MKWIPMAQVKAGRTFRYKGVKFLRIKPLMSIGKESFNLVHPPSGQLGFVDYETAVRVK